MKIRPLSLWFGRVWNRLNEQGRLHWGSLPSRPGDQEPFVHGAQRNYSCRACRCSWLNMENCSVTRGSMHVVCASQETVISRGYCASWRAVRAAMYRVSSSVQLKKTFIKGFCPLTTDSTFSNTNIPEISKPKADFLQCFQGNACMSVDSLQATWPPHEQGDKCTGVCKNLLRGRLRSERWHSKFLDPVFRPNAMQQQNHDKHPTEQPEWTLKVFTSGNLWGSHFGTHTWILCTLCADKQHFLPGYHWRWPTKFRVGSDWCHCENNWRNPASIDSQSTSKAQMDKAGLNLKGHMHYRLKFPAIARQRCMKGNIVQVTVMSFPKLVAKGMQLNSSKFNWKSRKLDTWVSVKHVHPFCLVNHTVSDLGKLYKGKASAFSSAESSWDPKECVPGSEVPSDPRFCALCGVGVLRKCTLPCSLLFEPNMYLPQRTLQKASSIRMLCGPPKSASTKRTQHDALVQVKDSVRGASLNDSLEHPETRWRIFRSGLWHLHINQRNTLWDKARMSPSSSSTYPCAENLSTNKKIALQPEIPNRQSSKETPNTKNRRSMQNIFNHVAWMWWVLITEVDWTSNWTLPDDKHKVRSIVHAAGYPVQMSYLHVDAAKLSVLIHCLGMLMQSKHMHRDPAQGWNLVTLSMLLTFRISFGISTPDVLLFSAWPQLDEFSRRNKWVPKRKQCFNQVSNLVYISGLSTGRFDSQFCS